MTKPKHVSSTGQDLCSDSRRRRLDLNSFKDDVWRSDMGRLFQSFGPTCENVRSPQVCLIRGNCKVCEVDERRLREGL